MRLYRITFATGFAAGFVAGTRAGRERYEQMVKFARATAENPAVQQAAGAIQAHASALLTNAAHKVSGGLHDRVPQMAQTAKHMVEDHFPGMKHRNGHRNAAANGGTEAGNARPFVATSNSHLGGTQH